MDGSFSICSLTAVLLLLLLTIMAPPSVVSLPSSSPLGDSSTGQTTTTSSKIVSEQAAADNNNNNNNHVRDLLLHEANYDCNNTDETQTKRANYLGWDDFFMSVASLSAQRSKDPTTPTGACIVDEENRIVGIGYNGFPRGCSDDCLPWTPSQEAAAATADDEEEEHKLLHTRDPYVVHAEVNAILNRRAADTSGCRMYVAHFPCNECAKIIIQSKIRQVIYMQDNHHDKDEYRASRIMLHMAGVKLRQYQPSVPCVVIDFISALAPTSFGENPKPTATTPLDKSNADRARYRELLIEEASFDPTRVPSTKRTNYLSWPTYFMAISMLTAKRSKDPSTQVGACIVDNENRIVGVGYNGFPRGCSDNHLPWSKSSELPPLHRKYHYVCHAEVNAILNKISSAKDATLYVALFPCNECAKMIIQAGIRQVVYLSDKDHDTDACRASRIMFEMAGVQLTQYVPEQQVVKIVLSSQDDDNDKQ